MASRIGQISGGIGQMTGGIGQIKPTIGQIIEFIGKRTQFGNVTELHGARLPSCEGTVVQRVVG